MDTVAEPTPEAAPSSAVRRMVRRVVARDGHLWPTLTFLVATVLVWTRPAWRDLAALQLANPGDSGSFAWYLSWNVHALTHGHDPFFTPNLYAPHGLDLGNAISVPSVSLLVSPVSAAFGGVAGYNTALVVAILFGSVSVYLLARELTGSIVGSTLAGLLMVVSPYVTGHSLGHLNLEWSFGLPLLAYFVVRRVRGRLRVGWLIGWTALVIAFTIGASTELMVIESVLAVVALLIGLIATQGPTRRELLRSTGWLALGVAAGVVLAAPVILAALRSGLPAGVANTPGLYSTDLTNVVAPTRLVLVGDSFFQGLRATWLGNDAENTAYLPVTLLILVATGFAVRRSRLQTAIGAFAIVAMVLSFGPSLNIAGKATIPMPWAIVTHVPALEHLLPGRFSQYVYIAACLLVAHVWQVGAVRRWFVGSMVALTFVLLIPNLTAMHFPSSVAETRFASDGNLARTVESGSNVLVLPAGQWGPGMAWEDDLDFAFTMPIGNGGGAVEPPELADPTASALYHLNESYDYAATLRQYLRANQVDMVIVDDRWPTWDQIVQRALGTPGEHVDGVTVYRGGW